MAKTKAEPHTQMSVFAGYNADKQCFLFTFNNFRTLGPSSKFRTETNRGSADEVIETILSAFDDTMHKHSCCGLAYRSTKKTDKEVVVEICGYKNRPLDEVKTIISAWLVSSWAHGPLSSIILSAHVNDLN